VRDKENNASNNNHAKGANGDASPAPVSEGKDTNDNGGGAEVTSKPPIHTVEINNVKAKSAANEQRHHQKRAAEALNSIKTTSKISPARTEEEVPLMATDTKPRHPADARIIVLNGNDPSAEDLGSPASGGLAGAPPSSNAVAVAASRSSSDYSLASVDSHRCRGGGAVPASRSSYALEGLERRQARLAEAVAAAGRSVRAAFGSSLGDANGNGCRHKQDKK